MGWKRAAADLGLFALTPVFPLAAPVGGNPRAGKPTSGVGAFIVGS